MATLKYNAKKLELLIPTARRHTQEKFRRDNISIRPSNIDDIVKAIYEDIEAVASATGITQSLVSLTDTPSAYSGDTNKIVGINSTDDGAEFKNWLISASNLYPGSAGGSIGKSGNGVGKIYFDTTGNLDYEGDLEILTNGTQKAVFKGTSGYLGVGVTNPLEPIHSERGIVIGNAIQSSAGTIQYTSGDFQGYDGSGWKSFLSSSSAGCGLTYNTTTNKIDLGGELNNNTASNNVRLYPSVGSNQVKWGVKLNDAGTHEVMPANASGNNHYYISHFEYWSFVGYYNIIGLFGQGAYGYGSGPQLGCLEHQGSISYLKMYKDVAQMTNASGHIQGFPGGTNDLLTFMESDSASSATRQIWQSAGSNTTSIISQTFDKHQWTVDNAAGHSASQRLLSSVADIVIPNADNSKQAMFLMMPAALYWKDGEGLGFTTLPNGTAIGGIATSAGTESILHIGLGTTDSKYTAGSNSNKRGIKLLGFGETNTETGAGANYSTLVNTSLVPKKYVDDAISVAPNLATTDLTQAAASRTYDMNNQNLLFNNGYFKITDAGYGDMFYLEHGGGDITFGGATGVGTGGSNWVHQTNFNVASSTLWEHRDFGGNTGLRIANWTTTGGLNSYATIEYQDAGGLYILQNGGGPINLGSSDTINIGYGTGAQRPTNVRLKSGAGQLQLSGTSGGSGSTTFTDYTSTPAGIEYNADYSANYSARSLIDKGYADATYATGTGISDGDKGDIVVGSSGTSWTIDTGVVTNAKLADVATSTFKGRTTAGTGVPEDLTAAQARTILNVEDGATADQTDSEIETAYNNQVDVVSQVDAEAGTSTDVKRWTPERVKQAIDALASGTTNLSEGTTTNTTVDVNSSTGTNATLASASTTRAGLMSKAKFDEVVANTAKVTNATHTGEVTGSGALTIASDVVDEDNLKVGNTPTDGYALIARSGESGGLKWEALPGQSTGSGTKVLVTGGFSGSGTYQTLANSTNNLLEFDDSVTGGTDVNGEWDNTAHRFTVNASGAGTYLFQASLFVESASAWGTIYLKKNGTQLTTQTLGSSSHNVGFDGVSGSVTVELAVGDYIEYYADWRNATGAIKDVWGADKQTFSISKIGESVTVNNVTLPSLTKTIVLEAPADADYIPIFRTDVAITIQEALGALMDAGDVDIRLYWDIDLANSGPTAIGAQTTLTSTTEASVDISTDATIPANSWIILDVGTVATPQTTVVNIRYTED